MQVAASSGVRKLDWEGTAARRDVLDVFVIAWWWWMGVKAVVPVRRVRLAKRDLMVQVDLVGAQDETRGVLP